MRYLQEKSRFNEFLALIRFASLTTRLQISANVVRQAGLGLNGLQARRQDRGQHEDAK